MATKKISILLVEDSAVQLQLMLSLLQSAPDIHVLDTASNGHEAIKKLAKIKPDLVLMDLEMPEMNGIEAIRHIMSTNPLPIVAISASTSMDEIINGFNALEAGALAFAEKPIHMNSPLFEKMSQHLLETIRLMSEVKVVKRRHSFTSISQPPGELNKDLASRLLLQEIKIIAIGVSTGGPLVLQEILSKIPEDFPPVLIVQHISPGFIQGLVGWLSQATKRPVHIGSHNLLVERGHIYFAPDHFHMGIMQNGRIMLNKNEKEKELCPSVDYLFQSVANNINMNAIGILLTGMGSDGVEQLKSMKEQGAITIAQTKDTSLIYGMPGQAVALQAASYSLSPTEIANMITSLSKKAP